MQTERAEALIRHFLTEGKVRPFIRSKVVRHIEAPMTQMLLGEPQVKQMAAQLARHGFTHESSMALNSKIAHHKFKRGHRLITVTRFKEPEGNRVVWSSAGLTGHGQDGRGEHYTTLATHLRAITPRRVHEEQSRFKIEPAPNSGIPPDFADYQNRAWISPEGKVHALKQGTPEQPWRGDTHGGWAVQNPHIHGEHGDLWTMFDNMQDKGWVRKTAKDFYDIGPYDEDSIATVHKHFTTHHPELDSVRVYSRENGGTLHRLYKGSVNEQIVHLPPSRFITEPSLDDAPGDWAEMHNRAWISPSGKVALAHVREKGDYYTRLKKVEEGAGRGNWLDTRDAGWIAPDDTYHKLSPGEVHDRWIKNNGNLLATTGVKPDALGYDKRAIIAAGWIQKHGENVYSAHDRSAVPRIVKHFTERHPGVKRAMISFKTGGNVYVTRDGTVREPVPYRAEESLQESTHERAWLEPTGKVHPVGDAGWFRTHQNWAATDESSPLRGHPDTEKNPFGVIDALIDRGWVRKGSQESYEARSEKLPLIHAHFTKNHPNRKAVHVVLRDKVSPDSYGPDVIHLRRDGSQERCKCNSFQPIESVNENWMRSREAAWVAPDDTVHPLRPGQFHMHWVMDNVKYHAPELVQTRNGGAIDATATEEAMLKHGWFKKQDKDMYHADPSSLGRVHKHFTTHHPEIANVHVSGAGRLGMTLRLFRDGRSEKLTYGVNENWLRSRKAAWLSPEGDVHPLEGEQYHATWVRHNYNKVPKSLHSYHPGFRMDAGGGVIRTIDDHATKERMLDHGWVRKQDVNIYTAHDPEASKKLILDHVRKHHPEVKRVRVTGKDFASQWWDVDHGKVTESWMHSRSAAWIDPEDNVHPLVGGQFHTDWIRANHYRIPAAHKRYYGNLRDGDGLDAYSTRDMMLGAGWIRKQDSNSYNVGDLESTRERIIKHVRQHHPRTERVRVNEPGKDSWIDILPEKVDEAWRGGTLDNWLQHRTAGWIAPDHTYHQLNPGEHHREWSTNPRNARHLRDVLRVIDPVRHWDANVVQHEMMKQGWIRKLDHDQYLVGRRSMIAQALRHHERFHPHKNRVEVAVENYPAQGMLHRFYFQRDPNTREILPRRDWREKRRLRKSQQDRKWGSSA